MLGKEGREWEGKGVKAGKERDEKGRGYGKGREEGVGRGWREKGSEREG